MRDALGQIRTVLVLGGDSDIGIATAHRLVSHRGARTVVLAGRDLERLGQRRRELLAAGAETVATVRFDALDAPQQHQATIDAVWAEHGDVDVTLLAFGVLGDQLQDESDAERALHVITTNYTGAVSVAVPISERLRRQGHGVMVVLSTIAAVQARRANFVYGSAKAGLDAFALGMGDALAGSGARVLVVRPGFVHTKMTRGMEEAPFSTTPEEVARAILDGIDGNRTLVHVPAPVAAVGAVLRNLPRPIVRKLPR